MIFEEIESITNKLCYSDTPSNLDVISISRKFPEIFNWIKLFDMEHNFDNNYNDSCCRRKHDYRL